MPPSIDFHTPPDAAPTKIVVLPSSLYAATAATRPLIAAEPMFRAPRPDSAPLSRTVCGGGIGTAPVADEAAADGGPSTIALVTRVPAGGKEKSESGASTFTSTRVMWKCAVFGSPLPPESLSNGIQTPATRA